MEGKWQETPLGDLVEIFDGPHATPPKTEAGPIFLGISNLSNGRIDLSSTQHLSEDDFARWTRRVTPSSGDVVFSYETRLGEAAIIPETLKCCLGRRMGLLRARPGKVHPRFLLYAYLGPQFQETLRKNTVHGSTVDRIPLIEMPNFPIAIPSDVEEQKFIADILGTLDDKIELNRQMNRTLEAIARAIFKCWFVDFDPVRAKADGATSFRGMPQVVFDGLPDRFEVTELGSVPHGWDVPPLEELIDVNPKRSLKKGKLAPYLAMSEMPTRGHHPEGWETKSFGSGMKFHNGDTLVARITPCLENGKTAFVDFLENGQVGWGSTEYIVLRPKPPIPEIYAYCLARSMGFRDFAIANMTGTSGRQRVPATAIAGLKIPRPPQVIARAFGDAVEPLFAMIAANHNEMRTLAALRDTLLPKLISGELRVSTAEAGSDGG